MTTTAVTCVFYPQQSNGRCVRITFKRCCLLLVVYGVVFVPLSRMCLLLLVAVVAGLARAQELVQNGDFESQSNWDCWGIQCSLSSDRHHGQSSLQARGRTVYYQGPSQTLPPLVANAIYSVDGWVKVLNTKAGKVGQTVTVEVDFHFTDDSHNYVSTASYPLLTPSDGWVHLVGDFQVPTKPLKETRLYFQGPDPGVDFAVDMLSVQPLPRDNNWRAESDSTIEKLRKANIDIHVTMDGGVQNSGVNIEIVQTKKSFAFGTAVAAQQYVSGDQRYRDFIHQHFNWAVIENALKWDLMESQEGHPDYNWNQGPGQFSAIKQLDQHGIKVRAHNIVWSVDQYVPSWLKKYSGDTLKAKVTQRVTDIVSKTKGMVEHWDVNNENLHGFWFQNTLNDRDYNLEIFRIAHRADPNVKLFLNDYSVVAGGEMTQAFLDQALNFKRANVGLYGIGVQCHFGENVAPDPTLIKKHLDILAKAGVPIWVTELDVISADENTRADYYETALRALYGHPAVEGIMLWGFWSKSHWRGEPATLVTGDSFTVNAAGRRFLDLVERQWMTHETQSPNSSGHVTTRGFLGDYEVRVSYQGKQQGSQTFSLGKNGATVNVHVHK